VLLLVATWLWRYNPSGYEFKVIFLPMLIELLFSIRFVARVWHKCLQDSTWIICQCR